MLGAVSSNGSLRANQFDRDRAGIGGTARVEEKRQSCRRPFVGIIALEVSVDASIRAVLCLAQGVEDRGDGSADGGGAYRSVRVEDWRIDVRRCGRLRSNDAPNVDYQRRAFCGRN